MTITIGRIIGAFPDGVPVWTFCEQPDCLGHGSCPRCWDAWADNYLANERIAQRTWTERVALAAAKGGLMLDGEDT